MQLQLQQTNQIPLSQTLKVRCRFPHTVTVSTSTADLSVLKPHEKKKSANPIIASDIESNDEECGRKRRSN